MFNKRWPEQVLTHVIDAARGLPSGVFLGPDDLLADRGIAPTKFSGPTQPDPSGGTKNLFPALSDIKPDFFIARSTAPLKGREFSDEVLCQPLFSGGTKLLVGDGRDIYRKGHGLTLGPDQSSFRTRAALSCRNLGQTLSLNGTSRISVMIRFSDRPIGK